MDIIFQSGEFHGQDSSFWTNVISIVAALLGAAISGLIAICVFKRGISEQLIKEANTKKEKFEELESYFFNLIGFMNITINQQVAEIARTSQDLKDFSNNNLRLNTTSALSTNEANSINNEDLYKIFVISRVGSIKEKASDFLNIKSCFRYIDQQKVSYQEFNDTMFRRLEEYRLSWNENLKDLLNLYNKFVLSSSKNSENLDSDSFLVFYKNIMVYKQREIIVNGNMNNIEIVHKEIIEPLKKYIKENNGTMDERIFFILTPLMKCDHAFIETKTMRLQKRETVLRLGRNLLGVKRLLNECIENTKKRNKVL